MVPLQFAEIFLQINRSVLQGDLNNTDLYSFEVKNLVGKTNWPIGLLIYKLLYVSVSK